MMGTKEPAKETFMRMAAFGSLSVEITPESAHPEILNIDIGSEHRKDTISMKTNKDETIDQFCQRLRGMLRALANGEPRVLPAEQIAPGDQKQPKTWEEQKASMKKAPVTV